MNTLMKARLAFTFGITVELTCGSLIVILLLNYTPVDKSSGFEFFFFYDSVLIQNFQPVQYLQKKYLY